MDLTQPTLEERFPRVERYGEGKKLLQAMRDAGVQVPAVVRIHEVLLGPGTSRRNADSVVLRIAIEFDDNQIRATSYRLDDIVYGMLRSEDSVVTGAWRHGTVSLNPPDFVTGEVLNETVQQRLAAALAKLPAGTGGGLTAAQLQKVFEDVRAAIDRGDSAVLAEAKRVAADATAKLAAANEKIKSLTHQLQRHSQHLANLETKTRKLTQGNKE